MAARRRQYLFTSESVTEGHPDKFSWERTDMAAALRDAAGLDQLDAEVAA